MRKKASCTICLLLMVIYSYANFRVGQLCYSVDSEKTTEVTVIYDGSYKELKEVIIPKTIVYKGKTYKVTAIRSGAFWKCANLNKIIISDNVIKIGSSAFANCSSLRTIKIPKNVTSFGDGVFNGCNKLDSITLPTRINKIGAQMFAGCEQLTSIIIPNSVTIIEQHAFSYCRNLSSVKISQNVTRIENSAFKGCDRLPVSQGLRYADTYLVEAIDTTLNTYAIQPETKYINGDAFSNCHYMTTIYIPKSVIKIGRYAFQNCRNLTSIDVDSDNLNYCSNDGVLFNKDTTTLIQFPPSKRGRYIIPKCVKNIEPYAFVGCTGLTSLVIGKNVKTIYCGTFKNCESLKEIFYSEGANLTFPNLLSSNIQTKSYDINQGVPIEAGKKIAPPLLELIDGSLSFTEPSNNNSIDADERCFIQFKIQNNGKGIAKNCDVRVKLKGNASGITVNTIELPSLSYGQTYEVRIPVLSNINTQSGKVTFSIEVYEPNGWGIAPFDLTVATRAYEPPFIHVVDYTIASNSGHIRKMQPFTLKFNLQNTKYGTAEDVNVKINLPANVFIVDGDEQIEYSRLESGEAKQISLTLIANNNYSSTNIPITIDVKEKYGKFAENRKIDLALNQVASGSITITAKNEPLQERNAIKVATIGSAVDKNIPVSDQSSSTTFAVIIANENYQQVAKVPFALNDGNVFKQYCEKTLGIPTHNIHFVGDATINNIKQQVNWLSQVIKAYNGSARVIFYYAGHGVPDEKSKTAFLLPVDGNGSDITTGYKLDDLYTSLGSLPSQSITIFLDACFSGSKREEGMLASARGVAIKVNKGQPTGNMVVFSAATGDETAYPNYQEGHGMFTYYLLKKLQDTKGDVTYEELGNYIKRNVSQQSIVLNGKSQTPCVTPSAAVGTDWHTWKLK